jgi:hypothetical protein
MRFPLGVIVLALSAVAWSQSQPVTWLIFIDDLHLQFVDTGRLRLVVRAIGRELVRPDGDGCLVRCSGPSCTAGKDAPTTCATLVDWRNATGNGLKEEDQLRYRSDGRLRELIYRAETAVTTADALLGEAPAGRRAALIYISNGYLAEARAADRLSTFAAAAAAKHVRVFPVTVKRVEYDPGRTPSISPAHWQALMNETAGSLEILASNTGGGVIPNPLDGGLAGILPLVGK